MRCEHCHTLVEGSNGTCPLCGAPLAKETSVFPPRKGQVRRVIVPFSQIYLSLTVLFTIAIGIINAFVHPQTHYWAIALMAAWYLYVTLRRTVLGLENSHYKMLVQIVAILVFLYTVALVFHTDAIIIWAIPAFYLAAWIVNAVIALASPKRANRYLLSLWLGNLLGGVNVVVCLSMHLYWVPAVVSGGVGLVGCVVLTCIRPKELWSQIKRTLDR